MNIRKQTWKAAVSAAAIAAGAAIPMAANADGYQFIVSGYPAVNVSYSAASSGTSLVTATRKQPTAAQSLEARYRTWDESDGIALRSDKFRGMILIVR